MPNAMSNTLFALFVLGLTSGSAISYRARRAKPHLQGWPQYHPRFKGTAPVAGGAGVMEDGAVGATAIIIR